MLQEFLSVHIIVVLSISGFLGIHGLVTSSSPVSLGLLAVFSTIGTIVLSIYVFLILGNLLIIMDDDQYSEWRDNFTTKQVIAAFAGGYALSISSVALLVAVLRLSASTSEKRSLKALLKNLVPDGPSPGSSFDLGRDESN